MSHITKAISVLGYTLSAVSLSYGQDLENEENYTTTTPAPNSNNAENSTINAVVFSAAMIIALAALCYSGAREVRSREEERGLGNILDQAANPVFIGNQEEDDHVDRLPEYDSDYDHTPGGSPPRPNSAESSYDYTPRGSPPRSNSAAATPHIPPPRYFIPIVNPPSPDPQPQTHQNQASYMASLVAGR